MARKDGTDILMQLVPLTTALDAECQTQVDPSDTFMKGFSAGTFFEVDSFGFGMKIDEQDAAKDKLNTGSGSSSSSFGRQAPGKDAEKAKKDKDKAGAFARWKTATADQLKTMKPYPVRMDEFDITKLYDQVSPVLFKYCCDSGSFKTATLVKRKDVGKNLMQGFLRLEFEDVLVTQISWDNDDVVKEKFKFVFRKLTVRYATTTFTASSSVGTLKEQPSVVWSYDTTVVDSKQAQ